MKMMPKHQPPKHTVRNWLDFMKEFDWRQIITMFFLLTFGLVFIYSTGMQAGTDYAMSFCEKQIFWIASGFIFWLFCSLIDYRKWQIPAVILYIICLVLLVVVLFFGKNVYGAKRWLDLSFIGMRIQPSEFMKIGLILFLAAFLSNRYFRVDKIFDLFLAALVIMIPFMLIVIEPDLGSSLVLLPIGFGMIFCAGVKWKLVSIITATLFCVLTLAIVNEACEIKPLLREYQKERILTFLDPERDIHNRGYNPFQARLAVGSGGVWGKGIGEGTQNALGFLPRSVSNNDFIFSVIAEETGFIGVLLLLLGEGFLIFTILNTAYITTDPYGRYIAIGAAMMLTTHCFINMGMSIGLTPVTGLSLPFISYGGSFIMTSMGILGIVQSIYRNGRDDN